MAALFFDMERNTLFLFQIEQGKDWLKEKDSLKVIDCIKRTLLCCSW